MSLSDAATAGDATAADAQLAEQLGPAPLADQPPTAPRQRSAGRSHHKQRVQAPSTSDLLDWLAPTLGLVTLVLGLLLAGLNLEDPLVEHVMMEQEEAEAIAKPLANILARQAWFARYGKQLIGSSDWIALSYALLLYAGRVMPAVSQRARDRGETRRYDRQQQAARVPANGAANGRAGSSPVSWPAVGDLGGAYTVDS